MAPTRSTDPAGAGAGAGAGVGGVRVGGVRVGGEWRRVAWVAVVAAALALLVVAGTDKRGAETDAERIQRLTESFACPVCKGESVADSNAAAGRTDAEIRDELVAGYTTRVLRNPPADGVATLVWVLPVLMVVGGAAGVTIMLGRLRPAPATVSDDDRELVRLARLAASGPDAEADEGL
jgi:cytochrome c-type biogenesis protein CcmH